MKKLFVIALLLALAIGCAKKTKVVVYTPAPADTCQHGHDDDHN